MSTYTGRKTAVIIGGAHGIGLATTELLLSRGATVPLTGPRLEPIAEAKAESTTLVKVAAQLSFTRPSQLASQLWLSTPLPRLWYTPSSRRLLWSLRTRRRRVSRRVAVLSPGFVDTPTMDKIGISRYEKVPFVQIGMKTTPVGRIASGKEVAKAAVFMEFEVTFSTGVEFLMNGGVEGV
ncbi:hypothetical protein EMCG_09205 [[Emmonsia] crescens]|uniref:3-oxoacyl-[acyl-carrier protein] reductase n=1 Tax=[Emmonsia] crescens TaxID=73230 RepID=A0A0G2I2Q3_9EURO|nr:hypothetical protein EMCG_09205 [Emmonsia crescens UAMH 3008]